MIYSLIKTWKFEISLDPPSAERKISLHYPIFKTLKPDLTKKLLTLCGEILDTIEGKIFAQTPDRKILLSKPEYQTLFHKLNSDFHRHYLEFTADSEPPALLKKYLESASKTHEFDSTLKLAATNPISLRFILAKSLFEFEILKNPRNAFNLLKNTKRAVLKEITSGLIKKNGNLAANLENNYNEDFSMYQGCSNENIEGIMIEYQYNLNLLAAELDKSQKSIFIANKTGYLKQFSLSGKFLKEYKGIHSGSINSMVCYKDWLYTADSNGNLKVFSVAQKKL